MGCGWRCQAPSARRRTAWAWVERAFRSADLLETFGHRQGLADPRVNAALPQVIPGHPPYGGRPPRRCPALGAVAIEASVLPALPLPGPASMRCALDASALVACGPGQLLWRHRP